MRKEARPVTQAHPVKLARTLLGAVIHNRRRLVYTPITAPNWAARFGSRKNYTVHSTTISTGGFFSSVEPMAGVVGSFQAGRFPCVPILPTRNLTRLPIHCLAAVGAANLITPENRNHAH